MNATIVIPNATARKADAISPARKNLRQIVTEWLELGMRQSGLSQTALAGKSGVHRATINRLVQGRQEAEQPTIKRLARAMKYPFPDFDVVFPAPELSGPKRYRDAPGVPQGSEGEEGTVMTIGETGLPYAKGTGPGLAAWLALGAEMQHNLAVKVIKEALEAQDFAGSPVLRALHGIAEKMDEMGYTAMSRHIWAEMGKYFGQQLPPGDEE